MPTKPLQTAKPGSNDESLVSFVRCSPLADQEDIVLERDHSLAREVWMDALDELQLLLLQQRIASWQVDPDNVIEVSREELQQIANPQGKTT